MIFWGRKNIAGECSLKYPMAPKLLKSLIINPQFQTLYLRIPNNIDHIDKKDCDLKGNFKLIYTYMIPGDLNLDLVLVSAIQY